MVSDPESMGKEPRRGEGGRRRAENVGSRERTIDGESDDGERRGSSESDKEPGKTPVRKSCQAGDSGLSGSRQERTGQDIRVVYITVKYNMNQ